MNIRIEQLTRTYLDSLHLSSSKLNDNQKQNIIRINNQSNWLIFNACSLRNSHRNIGADEIYDIDSPYLRELLKEQIKTYHQEDWKETFCTNDDERNRININHVKVKFFMFIREEWRSIGSSDWMAVNKTVIGDKFGGTTMDIDNVDLTLGVTHKKVERQLNNLLNDPDILNSTAPSASNSNEEGQGSGAWTSPPPNSSSTGTNTPPPPPQDAYSGQSHTSSTSSAQTIQFKIKSIEKYDDDVFDIEADSPITINGTQITFMDILGRKVRTAFQNGDLQPGNTIAITNIRFARNRAEITPHNELWIGKSYDEIQVVSSINPHSTSSSLDNPLPPTFFPEVGQENQELNQEENKMVLLAEELLKVIEDNNQICQEAQSLKLNLPKIPTDALNYFQEEFFEKLDENQPLNNFRNNQINGKNEIIRIKKLTIKKNIYGIYDNNKWKLAERKSVQTPPPPANALEKLKQEVKEKINQILADKDNLRNINLTTLASGKYQNWEKDIERLTTKKEVLAYVEVFVKALKEVGAKEKEKEQKEKNEDNKTNPDNSQNSSENSFVNDNVRKKIGSLPLPVAKNLAKNKIRELFKNYHPDLEKIKGVWEGEKSWMSYLEKCASSEEVLAFMEKLEKAIIQQSQKSQKNDKKTPTPQKSWILPLIVISVIVAISLAIIIKLLYKRKK